MTEVQDVAQLPVVPNAVIVLPWLAVTVIGMPGEVQATSSVKETENADVPCGGTMLTDAVPLPLTAQPAQLGLIKVTAALDDVIVMFPAPAWAVNEKPTGLPALTTKLDGVRPLTLASARGVLLALKTRAKAATSATGMSFNRNRCFIRSLPFGLPARV